MPQRKNLESLWYGHVATRTFSHLGGYRGPRTGHLVGRETRGWAINVAQTVPMPPSTQSSKIPYPVDGDALAGLHGYNHIYGLNFIFLGQQYRNGMSARKQAWSVPSSLATGRLCSTVLSAASQLSVSPVRASPLPVLPIHPGGELRAGGPRQREADGGKGVDS